MIVDYIFTEVLTRVFQYYNGNNVSDKTADLLERCIFKFILNIPIWFFFSILIF